MPEALINTAEAYPLWGTLENLPRTYIQLCEADILRDDGVCYAQGLREAGVEVRETLYKVRHLSSYKYTNHIIGWTLLIINRTYLISFGSMVKSCKCPSRHRRMR